MKEITEYEKDLASIRSIMERSVKFISLSGLSGVLAGIYALAGSCAAYYLIYFPYSPFGFRFYYINEQEVIIQLVLIAGLVLIASLTTGYLLSARKARKINESVWNNASRQLLSDVLVPLVSGGIFLLILISRGYFVVVAPACLLFYGLALIHGSRNTFNEIRYLGYTEIILGLVCALLPGYGLLFWAAGFGIMHIVYGSVMYYRHDQ